MRCRNLLFTATGPVSSPGNASGAVHDVHRRKGARTSCSPCRDKIWGEIEYLRSTEAASPAVDCKIGSRHLIDVDVTTMPNNLNNPSVPEPAGP
ncbi:hypothetical protein BDW75DRAFT_212738 [Aspergillus navahoensis]